MPFHIRTLLCVATLLTVAACRLYPSATEVAALEEDNPARPIPAAPLGVQIDLSSLAVPPTPERVRLGRWLFFDARLSRDGTISCASCHQPEHGLSQTTRVAAGIGGALGQRKVPTIVNLAIPLRWSSFGDVPPGAFFWDGRARTLEQQALEPIANPVEMGSPHDTMVSTLARVRGYERYFTTAFGDATVTKERVAQAIADFVRTRMSGNAPFDRWRAGDASAVPDAAKRGFALFTSPSIQCDRCHRPPLFTDGQFHNVGIGWNPLTATFADLGRAAVTQRMVERGTPGSFKTPALREISRHAPYMHDGSLATLHDVVEYYNHGANGNPYLDAQLQRAPKLIPAEVDDIVAFLKSLEGEGWQDAGPSRFPR